MVRPQFKVGEKVEWLSTQGALRVPMAGEVAALVPKDQHPCEIYQDLFLQQEGKPERWKLSYHGGKPRDHESYLVMVRSDGKVPTVYWPVVVKLKKVLAKKKEKSPPADKAVFEITPHSVRDTF